MQIPRQGAPSVTEQVLAEVATVEGVLVPVPAELAYDAADPYAVTMAFGTGVAAVSWTFARDLLVQGLSAPAGDGDVRVVPTVDEDGAARVTVELRAPGGRAPVELPVEDLRRFLDRTLSVVPAGEESAHVDLDTVIAGILSSSRI
jgi:sporulation and cell division protein SsgA